MAAEMRPGEGECVPSTTSAISEEAAAAVVADLKALAEPLRLRMLTAIAADPRGESCVCDLAALAEVSQPTVSHHLKVLKATGMVISERRGTWVWYRVAPMRRHAVVALLEAFAVMKTQKPSVLFVCVHNAGRSQMAAGWLRELAGDRIEVRSAGSMPADHLNPVAVEAMREVGIDITTEQPKMLTTAAVQESDVVITMGCGDACPYFPGKRYEDWKLEDPAGQGIDAVRPIRDEVRGNVETLIRELLE